MAIKIGRLINGDGRRRGGLPARAVLLAALSLAGCTVGSVTFKGEISQQTGENEFAPIPGAKFTVSFKRDSGDRHTRSTYTGSSGQFELSVVVDANNDDDDKSDDTTSFDIKVTKEGFYNIEEQDGAVSGSVVEKRYFMVNK